MVVMEQFEIPGKKAKRVPVPEFLSNYLIGSHLSRQFGGLENPLWSHQAQALNILEQGDNLVLSTGTASGKSLVFRCLAFHKALLDPDARVLVFYPLKALAEDQLCGWEEMAESLGFSKEKIGRIDGSVLVKDRGWILQNSRIVIMTPDVCHAWLMSNLALPAVLEFVRSLSTLILDEAHTLEGVFGSNFAFLVRRLMAARNFLLSKEGQNTSPLQFVAATATIQNPKEHLKLLTGAEFAAITHEKDGAPQYERLVAHVACPEGKESEVAKYVHENLLRKGRDGSFITFVDSRKGVEILAKQAGETKDEKDALSNAGVLPYRAGFEADDRRTIERRLRDGTLRGVVSTSALELGIDFPALRVGLSLGVPPTRKAYRQRLGRIGRRGPGIFVVIAPHNAFQMYGTSFREYHDMSVEPSYLYLDNRFMQFAHARCLAVELESLGAPSTTPTRVAWPARFRDVHKMARPGGNRSPEFYGIADLGGDTPHHSYPLRNVGEARFQITMRPTDPTDGKIGEMNQTQALRECYPGATYFHLLRAYRVVAWSTNVFDPSIRVTPTASFRLTQPKIITWVNASTTSNGILDNHIVQGDHGFLAECQMQVTERVEGYYDHKNNFYDYRELQQKNSNMRPRSRNFRTSGLVLYINRDWFKGSIKKALASRLREVFIREYSISTQDVHSADTKISLQNKNTGENWVRGKCIVVYDEIYGSLRLTEKLYLKFRHVLDRLHAAVDFEEDANLKTAVAWVRDEVSTIGGGKEGDGAAAFPDDSQSTSLSQDYVQVFAEGSVVCWRQKGQMGVEVKIIEPIIEPEIHDGELLYRIESRLARQLVRASLIEPSANADAWSYAWWNRRTQMYEEPPEEEEDGD